MGTDEEMIQRFNYRPVLRWIFVFAIFLFLGRMVWDHWNQVREASFTLRPLPFFLSTLVFIISYFVQVWAWYLITLGLGIAIPFKETIESWFYSQLGKYLPGKVWILLSRFRFYNSEGKSKKAITVALYYETVTLVVATGLLFLVSLLFVREIQPFVSEIPLLALLLLFSSGFLFLHPKILERIVNTFLKIGKREPLSISIPYSSVLWILSACVLSWVVGGIGFYLFVESVFPISPRYFPFLTGALAFSSTLGLIALFAPSGLGVREGALVFFLSSIMPPPVAVVISILTRLWMTFIEIGLIGMVYIIVKLQRGVERRDRHVKT